MANRTFNVLFLCTGNSARSIMAECAMNRWGKGKFKAFSAGSHPAGAVHPMTLQLLNELNYETRRLRSKSWDEFARPDSPPLDFVFTVCDRAAAERCPLWPGQPITAHWGAEDPASFVGSEEAKRRFFLRIYTELENRIKIFTSLPFESLDRFALERRVREIGTVRLPDDK
jgi:protein-tyrosine-phosphatase